MMQHTIIKGSWYWDYTYHWRKIYARGRHDGSYYKRDRDKAKSYNLTNNKNIFSGQKLDII